MASIGSPRSTAFDFGGMDWEEPASLPLTLSDSVPPSIITDSEVEELIKEPVPKIGRLDVLKPSDGEVQKVAGSLFLYYASRTLTGSAYDRTYFGRSLDEQNLCQSAHNWLVQEGLITNNPRKHPIALGALSKAGEIFHQTFTARDRLVLGQLQSETKTKAGQMFLHYYSHVARGEAYSRVYFTDSLDSVKQLGYQHSHDWLVENGLISHDHQAHPIIEGALRKAIDLFYPSLYTDEQLEALRALPRSSGVEKSFVESS